MLNKNPLPGFILKQPHLLIFALLATMSSGFGQTFFISIFGGEIRAAFNLSHTVYGSLYATATVVSALLLVRLGTLVDIWPLRRVAAVTVLILAAGCLLMAAADQAIMLWLAFLLIRLGGQGMMGHLGMTVAGRYFSADRGKAVAFIAMGFPLSEAVFPVSAVSLMQGAIRVIGQGAMILSTALAPVLFGWLLDNGVAIAVIGYTLAGATMMAASMAWLAPRL